MKIYGYVEKGIGKKECQDRVLIGDTVQANGFLEVESDSLENILVAVADGVGGYAGAEKASLLAVDGLRALNRRSMLVEDDIRGLVENINRNISMTGRSFSGMENMSTTLTALVMNKEKALSVHIGNCRLCTHGNLLRRLTMDHTEVEDMVRRGELTRKEAWVSPIRNRIYACLGGQDDTYFSNLEVQEHEALLQQKNNLILTCDGIHDYVDESDLEDFLCQSKPAKQVIEEIVKCARENGSKDDISIIIVDRLDRYQTEK